MAGTPAVGYAVSRTDSWCWAVCVGAPGVTTLSPLSSSRSTNSGGGGGERKNLGERDCSLGGFEKSPRHTHGTGPVNHGNFPQHTHTHTHTHTCKTTNPDHFIVRQAFSWSLSEKKNQSKEKSD